MVGFQLGIGIDIFVWMFILISQNNDLNKNFKINIMKKKTSLTIGYMVCLVICVLSLASCDRNIKEMNEKLQTQIDKLTDSSKTELTEKNYPYLFKRLHCQNGLMEFGTEDYWIRKVDGRFYSLVLDENRNKKISLEVVNDSLLIMRKATTFINVVDVDGMSLRLLSCMNSDAILFVKNLFGKQFAYVDRIQTANGQVMVSELNFSLADTLTIHAMPNSHLIFYEFETSGNQMKLKAKAGVSSLERLFHL